MELLELKKNFHSYCPQLAEDVELIYGAEGAPLLYKDSSKKYVRISKVGIEVIEYTDGFHTIDEIAKIIANKYAIKFKEVEKLVYEFFHSLRQASLLTINPISLSYSDKIYKKMRNRPILKLPLVKSVQAITNSTNSIIGKLSRRLIVYLYLVATLFSIVSISYFLITGKVAGDIASVQWIVVILLYILHFIIHELGHAVILKRFGINVREAGLGLLYFFIPIAYVDTTDAYRLQRRFDRAALAIIGPIIDLTGACISSYLMVYGPGVLQNEFFILFIFQVGACITNLNPLLPTDGLHTIEACVGELNLRQRSFDYLIGCLIMKKETTKFKSFSNKRRRAYFIYGLFSFIYLMTIISLLFISLFQYVYRIWV